ncbi:hypothetical protein [Bryobacter aggregatus]|uniref:hypothetical protein n=1 Tax=Bryobacter aggregatus TaxID=360054 RepID=UPI0004E21AA5|nr:hypothetical protein [Bryobacter aggregatus]
MRGVPVFAWAVARARLRTDERALAPQWFLAALLMAAEVPIKKKDNSEALADAWLHLAALSILGLSF